LAFPFDIIVLELTMSANDRQEGLRKSAAFRAIGARRLASRTQSDSLRPIPPGEI
jgi:hypothetical protein